MRNGDEADAHEVTISTPNGPARAIIGIDGGRLTLTILEVPDDISDGDHPDDRERNP